MVPNDYWTIMMGFYCYNFFMLRHLQMNVDTPGDHRKATLPADAMKSQSH